MMLISNLVVLSTIANSVRYGQGFPAGGGGVFSLMIRPPLGQRVRSLWDVEKVVGSGIKGGKDSNNNT